MPPYPLARVLLVALTLAGCSMNEAINQKTDQTDDPNPVPTPQEIRANGNHLVDQPSLYLQQHAHNPIDWYPWDDTALSRAKTEEKPIFLSIGYSSCHWCHVMEHEVFEHDDVAAFMNAHFVCIKVDREERPDLDAVYMEAVQLMTGRGGWPMSVFLTPDLKPFYGGTYFPKAQFMDLAGRIEDVFRKRRHEVDQQAEQMAEKISDPRLVNLSAEPSADAALSKTLLTAAVASAQSGFDPVNGGFRQAQKFPTPVKWRFLLHSYRQRQDSELGRMILKTCQAMAQGGLYDHVGGGFHRYTVDAQWTVPHFEKMLYDNGQMAGLMLEAGVALDRDDFTQTGLDVLDFLMRQMRSDHGAFYASYDADSGGVEGSYYVWDEAEITAVVGATDGPALAAILGVSKQGNFEHTGKSVLTLRADLAQISQQTGRSEPELSGLFDKHRPALRTARDQRTAPGLDRKIVTSWNGLTIAALAQGYAVSGDKTYLQGAREAADFLLSEHRRNDGSLWRASSGGRHTGEGILDDYAFLADGLLDLYQVSGQSRYLAAARQLIDYALEHFSGDEGGFYMSAADVQAPLGRRMEFFDSVIPSGNSVMLVNLIRLSALTGQTHYQARAQSDLNRASDLLSRAGLEMAWWFEAVMKSTEPFYDVVIAADDVIDDALSRTLLSHLPANAVVSLVPAEGADKQRLKLAPALKGKVALDDQATAYVCEFGTCQAPTGDVSEMMKQLTKDLL